MRPRGSKAVDRRAEGVGRVAGGEREWVGDAIEAADGIDAAIRAGDRGQTLSSGGHGSYGSPGVWGGCQRGGGVWRQDEDQREHGRQKAEAKVPGSGSESRSEPLDRRS